MARVSSEEDQLNEWSQCMYLEIQCEKQIKHLSQTLQTVIKGAKLEPFLRSRSALFLTQRLHAGVRKSPVQLVRLVQIQIRTTDLFQFS